MIRRLHDLSEAWRGGTVLVAASGPSQRQEDIEAARDRCPVVVLNSTWKLAPWADMLYACDRPWWDKHGPSSEDFAGVRVIGKGTWRGCAPANCTQPGHPGMIWDGQRIGGGWNSGFQVLNLLARWKVARVIFTGLDCKPDANDVPHWHGHYSDGVCPNPQAHHFAKWVECFTAAAPVVAARGVDVVNASRDTALACFRRATVEEALA